MMIEGPNHDKGEQNAQINSTSSQFELDIYESDISSYSSEDEEDEEDDDEEIEQIEVECNVDGFSETKYRCDFPGCGKLFKSRSYLNRHKNIHSENPKYQCKFEGCYKVFSKSYELNRHKLIHGEKMFTCEFPECNKTFRTKEYLKLHQLIHEGKQYRYKCDWVNCDRSFTTMVV